MMDDNDNHERVHLSDEELTILIGSVDYAAGAHYNRIWPPLFSAAERRAAEETAKRVDDLRRRLERIQKERGVEFKL